ncbi:MAG: hypothetical protein RLY34_883, partial [Actinomycetota bacterium]
MKTEPTAIELFSDLSGTLVRATISTFGGALKKLSVNKIDIVPPTEGHTPNRYGDGIVLAPWANRINHGQWTHEGKTLQLEVNEKDLDNALHGLVGTANFE